MKRLHSFFRPHRSFLLLALTLILGAFFRFYGLDWDQGFHLHPDERFLTMVGTAMKIPQNFSDYLNPQKSSINPTNIGFPFFVYGTFPIVLTKLVALFFHGDNYTYLTLFGRFLSALFDLMIVVLIYKTVELFEHKYDMDTSIKWIASFFYTIAVLPIQLSHFFAVDTLLNFFMFASMYCMLRASFLPNLASSEWGKILSVAFSAIFLGLAIASKLNGVFILPLNLFFLARTVSFKKPATQVLLFSFYFIILYLSTRLADPYLFATPHFFDLRPNDTFIASIKALESFGNKDAWYPPAVQWINKSPVTFSLTNLAIFGLGLPYFVFLVVGIFFLSIKKRTIVCMTILLWSLGIFFYQSTQFVKAMRYFIFIYPFLAIFAGTGFYYLTKKLRTSYKTLILLLLIFWPLMFVSIYGRKNSRVAASEWIYKNLPNESLIIGEHWDDPLPLPVGETFGKHFTGDLLPVFDPDTQVKWQKINDVLEKGDYIILSSNRGWGSIPTVPERYPLMTAFYKDLFAEKLAYRKIKEFTSYPQFSIFSASWRIQFPDDWADESFTVYDHPKVMIFKKF